MRINHLSSSFRCKVVIPTISKLACIQPSINNICIFLVYQFILKDEFCEIWYFRCLKLEMRKNLQRCSKLATNFERLQAIEDKLNPGTIYTFQKKIATVLKQILFHNESFKKICGLFMNCLFIVFTNANSQDYLNL